MNQITLENGKIINVGLKELKELRLAIKSKDPLRIAISNIKLVMSSDYFNEEFVKVLKELEDTQ